MPSIGSEVAMHYLRIKQDFYEVFFDTVGNELIPSLRRDGYESLAERLEFLSEPIEYHPQGFFGHIGHFLHMLRVESELGDRRLKFLGGLTTLPTEEKAILKEYVERNPYGVVNLPRRVHADVVDGKSREQQQAVAYAMMKRDLGY